MTEELKELLKGLGAVSISLEKLSEGRNSNARYASLDEYCQSLGPITSQEPIVVMRISSEGETRVLEPGMHDWEYVNDNGERATNLSIFEMPEDDFWYFGPIQEHLFEFESKLPPFLYEMAFVYAYIRFEGYLSEIIKKRLKAQPELMGSQRELKYQEIFDASSKEELILIMVDRAIKDIMFLPLSGIVETMQKKLGFKSLQSNFIVDTNVIALKRNCIVHNGAKADQKLASAIPEIPLNTRFEINREIVEAAITVLRKFAYQIDLCFTVL